MKRQTTALRNRADHSRTNTTKTIRRFGLLLALGASLASAQTPEKPLDEFKDGFDHFAMAFGQGLVKYQTGTSMVGGNRYVWFNNVTIQNGLNRPAVLDIVPGALISEGGTQAVTQTQLVYGVSQNASVFPLNLYLDPNLYNTIRVYFKSRSTPINLCVHVWGPNYGQLGQWSTCKSVDANVNWGYPLEAVDLPFSTFGAVGTVDWANISRISFLVQTQSGEFAITKIVAAHL